MRSLGTIIALVYMLIACQMTGGSKSSAKADAVAPAAPYATFCDWYEHRNEISPGARATVNYLMGTYGSESDGSAPPDCHRVQNDIFSNALNINLDNPQLANVKLNGWDLQPLATLSDITEVAFIVNDYIPPLASLKNCPNIHSLEFVDSADVKHVDGLEHLSEVPWIETLFFHQFNFDGQTQWLSGMRKLRTFKIEGSDFNDSDLRYAVPLALNLNDLMIHDAKISDLAPIGLMVNLKRLSLWKNHQLRDIMDVKYLINLEDLSLEESAIEDISPLANLSYLKSLHLCCNSIRKVDPLLGLNNLSRLYLDANWIEDFSGLRQLKNLWYLDVSNNPGSPESCPTVLLPPPPGFEENGGCGFGNPRTN